jgi:hypothetical protein
LEWFIEGKKINCDCLKIKRRKNNDFFPFKCRAFRAKCFCIIFTLRKLPLRFIHLNIYNNENQICDFSGSIRFDRHQHV